MLMHVAVFNLYDVKHIFMENKTGDPKENGVCGENGVYGTSH